MTQETSNQEIQASQVKYEPFPDIHALVKQLMQGHVWYQAPLDPGPRIIHVKRFSVDMAHPLRSVLTFWTAETRTLNVRIHEHFTRFRRRAE